MIANERLRQASVDDPLKEIRHQLISLLALGRFMLPRFKEMPYDWRPEQVINPMDGQPFTRRGACYFIRERLQSGCPIEPIILDVPYGKTAYVMLLEIGDEVPELYVKLQLGSGYVIGRSFHYSTKPKRIRS